MVLLTSFTFSCGNSDRNQNVNVEDSLSKDNAASSQTITKVKFEPFNNVDDVRQKLSSVGIGDLGRWRDDEMGGYMSITPYYEFGDNTKPNNLAYYLERDNSSSIKTLKLVLNINNGDRKAAIAKFNEVISETYRALKLEPDTKTLNLLKYGKELSAESEFYTTRTEKVKSNIESWNFIIETK